MLPLAIPSPSVSGFDLGSFPIRFYSILILAGVIAAVWVGGKRFATRTEGGTMDDMVNIAFWAFPLGIVGARLYHVFSSPSRYFGDGGDPLDIIRFWDGGFTGLSIWGGIAGGAVGAYIACRRHNLSMPVLADALAPGLLFAQAIGRFGNYFNQELYGAPTSLPWGLRIDAAHLVIDPATGQRFAEGTLFHPTFLYEALWNVGAAFLIIWLDRRLRLGHGRVFALYVVAYTAGRTWIEMLRVDPSSTFGIFGLDVRLNVITSLVLFLGGLAAFILLGRKHPEREDDARRTIPVESDEIVPA